MASLKQVRWSAIIVRQVGRSTACVESLKLVRSAASLKRVRVNAAPLKWISSCMVSSRLVRMCVGPLRYIRSMMTLGIRRDIW